MSLSIYEGIEQIYIYLPGSMIENENVLSVNDLYIAYCSSVTVIILDKKTKIIKNIVNKSRDNFVKSIALNKGNKSQIAIFYDYEIYIYDIRLEQILITIDKTDIIFMEFNIDNIFLALTSKGELSYFDIFSSSMISKKEQKIKLNYIKTKGNVLCVKWFPFDSSSLAYANDKNIIYFIDIKNNSKNLDIEIISDDEEDSKMKISCIEWYDIDENYNYLLAGTTTSRIYLIDFNINGAYIITIFEKTGNSIKHLFWLNFQPGSFISINDNSSKYNIWNVSKTTFNSMKKIGHLSINKCVKYNEHSILFNDIHGNVILYNLKNNNITYLIENAHCQTIFDLKINPFLGNIFATASFDSTIKIWDLSKKKILNTLYTENYSYHIGGNFDEKLEKNHIISLKWSPIDKNYLSSGDSYLYLRIWDIEKNKQICGLLCYNSKCKNNMLIHGIDWNKNNNIIISAQNTITVVKFDSNNKNLNKIKTIEIGNNVFKSIFNIVENSIIVPLSNGSINIYNDIFNNKEKNLTPTIILSKHKHGVYDLKFNNEHKLLASSSNDFKIGLWDFSDLKDIKFLTFLLGHSDKVRELIWFKNNILGSGSWDNTIRLWNIKLLICFEIIKGHQSDVYGLDISPIHPFLFLSSSRDNTIRVFNVKNSFKLNSLIEFCNEKNENEIINLGEKITNEFLYDDGIEDLWKILKNNINKRYSFVEEYILKREKLDSEIDNFFNNTSIDFSSRKNTLIDQLIEESAKLGNWEKYCELLIYQNNWEDAICAAPHVSKEYWQYLINRYENYCREENNINEINAGLLNNNYNNIIDELLRRKEYQAAQIVYLSKVNKKKIKEKPKIKNDLEEIDDEIKIKINNELNENKEIDSLINNSANNYLIQGYPILACNSFLIKKDYNNAIKCLIQSFNYEIAFVIMRITKVYTYNNEIISWIYYKMKNSNNISSIILESKCSYNQYIYLQKIKEVKLFNINQKDIITQYIMKEDLNYLYNEFIQLSENFIESLCDKNNINENIIVEIVKIIDVIKELEIRVESLNSNISQRLIIIVLLLETLNFNYLACICLIIELIFTKKVIFTNKNDIKSLSYICNFLKYCKNHSHNPIYIDYNLSYEHNNYIKKIIQKTSVNGNYIGNYNLFSSLKDLNCKKFKCDFQLKRFFFLKNETFPSNNDKKINSSISDKPIKSMAIKLKSGNIISKSEYLEMSKYLYIN